MKYKVELWVAGTKFNFYCYAASPSIQLWFLSDLLHSDAPTRAMKIMAGMIAPLEMI